MNIEDELNRVERIAEATQGLDAEATDIFWRTLWAWRQKVSPSPTGDDPMDSGDADAIFLREESEGDSSE